MNGGVGVGEKPFGKWRSASTGAGGMLRHIGKQAPVTRMRQQIDVKPIGARDGGSTDGRRWSAAGAASALVEPVR